MAVLGQCTKMKKKTNTLTVYYSIFALKQTFSPPGPPPFPSRWTPTGGWWGGVQEKRGGEGKREQRREGWGVGESPLSCPPTQGPLWSPAWVEGKRKARVRTHAHTHAPKKNKNDRFLTPNVKCGKRGLRIRVFYMSQKLPHNHREGHCQDPLRCFFTKEET